MAYLRSTRAGLVPAMLLAATAGCSGGDLVLPQDGAEIRVGNVGGDQQTGTVGEALPKPLTVALRDEAGNAIVGRQVAFEVVAGPAAATLTPPTAVSDGDGEVVGQWVLGTAPGAYVAEARVLPTPDDPPELELPVVSFKATARAGPPDTLRAESETNQSGRAGSAVDEAPVVRVVDRYGNRVEGAVVRWVVTAGEGEVDSETTTTDADGRASVGWTLGNRLGFHRLEARVDGDVAGSPVVFSAFVFF